MGSFLPSKLQLRSTLVHKAAMNMAAYAAATGREVDDVHFQKQFLNYFKVLVNIERELLNSYRNAILHLDDVIGSDINVGQ